MSRSGTTRFRRCRSAARAGRPACAEGRDGRPGRGAPLPNPRGPGGGRGGGGHCLRLGRGVGGRPARPLGSRAGRRVRDVRRGALRPIGRLWEPLDIACEPDAIGGPVQSLASAEAARACDQVDHPAACPRLVVEPHAGPGAGDDDRETTFAAPAPFLAGARGGLAQKLGRDLGSPGTKLGVEGLPVAPAHRVPRGTDTPTRDDPRDAAAGHEGWRGRADKAAGTGFGGCFPPILPPLRHGPRRRSRSSRRRLVLPKTADPFRQLSEIRSDHGWSPSARNHTQQVARPGGAARRMEPFPGRISSTVPPLRPPSPTRGQPKGRGQPSGSVHRSRLKRCTGRRQEHPCRKLAQDGVISRRGPSC